ncbi:MAG TPA: asparagine synthase (glutamine-hydrolyzing), partial [Pirellulales bacterium]|nr:asparagine synthase (glutamine-hydrolyzing) [Pirellulales bacterium]
NGEIYNFRDLRRRLEGSGHRFRTQGDVETIVHLYEDEGVEFAKYLWGMFAIAIWDAPRRQLVLARDRLGKKPLVYRAEKDRVLFASELKCLLAAPGVPREIDPGALDEYLTYQYVPHPNTIFRGIRKLPPAHYAVWRDGRLTVSSYWQPDFNHEVRRSTAEYVEDLRSRLTDAVRLRLQSDVPLGAFLSGGVDSSIVVGLMSQLGGGRVKTFSIGFPEPDYDETRFAREVAERFGTDHHEFRVEPNIVDLLPKLAWHYDEPMSDSSAVPTWYVSELTRREVTVALTGDGGDELFAGYDRYRAVRLSALFDTLPRPLRRMIGSRLWQHLPGGHRHRSIGRRLRRFVAALNKPIARRYLDWIGIFDEPSRAALYSDEFLAELPSVDPAEFLIRAWRRADRRDPVTAASLADLVTYLPCDLLTKVDIASMAHGLECRQPFLDHRVVELAIAMPIQLKQRSGRGKRILLKAFGDLLPKTVQRRPKMGFGIPLETWLRRELRGFTYETLLDPRALGRGYFRPEAVSRLIEEHQSGARNHSYQLWSLLVLELWHRQWMDSSDTSPTCQRGESVPLSSTSR